MRRFRAWLSAPRSTALHEMPTLLNTGGKATEYSATAVPGLQAQGTWSLGWWGQWGGLPGWIGGTSGSRSRRKSCCRRQRARPRADARPPGDGRDGRPARHCVDVCRGPVAAGLLADSQKRRETGGVTRRLIVQEFMAHRRCHGGAGFRGASRRQAGLGDAPPVAGDAAVHLGSDRKGRHLPAGQDDLPDLGLLLADRDAASRQSCQVFQREKEGGGFVDPHRAAMGEHRGYWRRTGPSALPR